jgi:hypothetical protein
MGIYNNKGEKVLLNQGIKRIGVLSIGEKVINQEEIPEYFVYRSNNNGTLSAMTDIPDYSKIRILHDGALAGVAYNQTYSDPNIINFDSLEEIHDYGLYSGFRGCKIKLSPLSFSKLKSIGKDGMNYCFGSNSYITTLSFPKLEIVEEGGLYNCFYNCSSLTEIHFPQSLSNNPECTASNMGCTSATIYFDL